MIHPTIYPYIKAEEARFETDEIHLGDNWTWNFRKHVQLIFHLKNGMFFTGENNWLRAFKNIIDPILNLAYWTEDIELKDVEFFIEEENGRALSFLVKKYHSEVFARKNNLDTFIDEITESDLDYGGVLVQKTNDARPEVLHLNSLAFCDQTDILGGPIGFKHHFSPNKLRSMSKLGWGDKKNGATISIEELIKLAEPEKASASLGDPTNKVPGKSIEVYIVRGSLPESFLKDKGDPEKHVNQLQIVAFYTDSKNKKEGVCLYRKEETEGALKFHTSKKVFGRALGRGQGEMLLQPQVWTNFLEIHKMQLLEAASKVPLFTDDVGYANRNRIQNMENLEITTIDPSSKHGIKQVPTAAPANIQLFERSVNEWFEHAQFTGSAFDPIMGKEPNSGTTFRGQERVVQQGRGLHERRRGQRAKFIEEIYRDWIIPHIAREITKGQKFLATLSSEEMAWVSEQMAENCANKEVNEDILSGRLPRDKEQLKQQYLQGFSKKGNKQLLEILEDEFDGIELKMGINVAGKQKDLVGMSDKIFSIFQSAFANPINFMQTLQIPGMAQAFNDILEFGGISPIEFSNLTSSLKTMMEQAQQMQAPPTQALPQPKEPAIV